MHQRIVFAVSGLLFALVAVVVGIMTDIHDRAYPVSVDATSTLYLDFTRSGLADTEALALLAEDATTNGVTLLKVQPRLEGDQTGQDFVVLHAARELPATAGWFNDQPAARIRTAAALEHSFATGNYVASAPGSRLDTLTRSLTDRGVRVKREDDSLGQTATLLLRQPSFRTTLLACLGLMVAMALYWIAVRARARALQVLGGVSTARIQLRDLGGFLLAVGLAALPAFVVMSGYLGLAHDWRYIPYAAGTLAFFAGVLVAATAGFALLISVMSWPTTRMLARREPAVQSLRRASGLMKAVTFMLVLTAVGPAFLAYREASATAAQQAQWKRLADQVAFRYPAALGEDGFRRVTAAVGKAVSAADRSGDAALSYAMTPEQVGVDGFGSYDTVALVNEQWLELMLGSRRDSVVRSGARLPGPVRRELGTSLGVWLRDAGSASSVWQGLTVLSVREPGQLPLAQGGSGDLLFPDRALVIVVPQVAQTLNDDFLASLASSNNLVFDGLEPTMRLLAAQGLEHTIQVKYVAEDGVLRAQFAAYQAWLRGTAIVGLLAALALAAGISAFITALVSARRDFPLRLNGESWAAVLQGRVVREWGIGLLLATAVLVTQPVGALPVVLATAVLAFLAVPVSHLAASRWCFANVSLRRL